MRPILHQSRDDGGRRNNTELWNSIKNRKSTYGIFSFYAYFVIVIGKKQEKALLPMNHKIF